MKQLLPLAPALLLLAACQSTPSNPAAEVAAPAATQPAPPPAEPANPEHIEWSDLTINGKPREALSTQLLTSQLGRPDSIAKGAVECGGELEPVNNTNGDFWYYGKTHYEVAGSRAIITTFDVTTGKFQGKLGQLVLNQNTTLEDVRRFFPVSAKESYDPITITLAVYANGVLMDSSLNLRFKHGRLQEVEFFNPC
jgi:hypothetical protein